MVFSESLGKNDSSLRNFETSIRSAAPHEMPDNDPEDIIIAMLPDSPQDLSSPYRDPDGHTDCLMHASMKEQILKTPDFPQPILRPPNNVVRHRVDRSRYPGGGLGVFATVDLKQGDLIFSERAFFITSSTIRVGGNGPAPEWSERIQQREGMKQRETELELMLNRMSKEDKKAYLALHNSQHGKEVGPLLGIWETNAFRLQSVIDLKHKNEIYCGVFKDGSRINTSCSPSVGWSFNLHTFAMEFRALRNIEQGEELTTLYNQALLSPCVIRQKALIHYGFTCQCNPCKSRQDSDASRQTIYQNPNPERWRLVLWLIQEEPKRVALGDWVVENSTKIVQLIEQEGLEETSPYDRHLAFLVDAYRAMGNAEGAFICLRKYEAIRRVRHGGEEKSGPNILRAVKSHRRWDWASRVKEVIMYIGMASA
ncbi:hypothetical protein V5O48_015538 [Marasmius crinis-equi]|uniref:SET domain-containing protein n=1 Tax=Marasmius crinis-equi TaxID=585013 RepID=A0ABR3EU84_9AGAR